MMIAVSSVWMYLLVTEPLACPTRAAGPWAPESIDALRGHQPTPHPLLGPMKPWVTGRGLTKHKTRWNRRATPIDPVILLSAMMS
jgi:hypothetical protein